MDPGKTEIPWSPPHVDDLAPAGPPKSRKQRLMEAATREYTTRCIACDAIVAHGRVKGRTEAALNASNQAKIDAHKRTCPGPSEAGLEEPQK